MRHSPHPSTADRRGLSSFAPMRAFSLALFALIVACVCLSNDAFAQQPGGSSEAVAPSNPDDEPQELHDAASLDGPASSSPAEPSAVPVEKAVVEPAAAPVRDLLSERLDQGDGSEPNPVPFEDEEGVSYVLVTTEPHETLQHARNDLQRRMLEVARVRYADATSSPQVEFWYPVDLAFVRGELLIPNGERFIAGAGGQPQIVGHALLKFDEAFERRLRAVRVASRSMQVVVAGGSALALLSVGFAFLRLDRATRGLYTGRLQTWAIVAGAVVICIAGAVAYWIPWI